MVKLRSGPASDHIKVSHSSDCNINKFYHTRYGSEYGRENFTPRKGRHVGTGYSANFRPGVYYSRSLDQLDNPVMGFLLTDNYETMTKRHFRVSVGSNGKDPFPARVINHGESGFIRQRPLTVPTVAEIRENFYDTRPYGASTRPGLLPKHRALLRKIQSKDPVEDDNCAHGPPYMKSETRVRFLGEQGPPFKEETYYKDVGNIEVAGDVHNHNIEPITYRPDEQHANQLPGTATIRPTGPSLQETSYTAWQDASGKEPLPEISKRATNITGFVRDSPHKIYQHRVAREAYTGLNQVPRLVAERIKKNDPAEFLNLINPDNTKSVTGTTFLGWQKKQWTEEEQLERENVGDKELSGDCLNNDVYMETKDDNPQRYLTDYNMRHYDMNPEGVDREGWVMGGLQTHKTNGYTRDFHVHDMGRADDLCLRLQRLHPYVSRSKKQRDRFYGEASHQHKLSPDLHGQPKVAPLSTATLAAV